MIVTEGHSTSTERMGSRLTRSARTAGGSVVRTLEQVDLEWDGLTNALLSCDYHKIVDMTAQHISDLRV